MGRLSGFRYRDVAAKLRKAGFTFDRQAKGSHEWHPTTRARTTLINHPGTLPEGTVRAIIRQAGGEPNRKSSARKNAGRKSAKS